MGFRPFSLFASGLLFYQMGWAQAPTLNLLTYEAPPYQVATPAGQTPNRVTGETVDTIECAAGQAGWSVRVRMAPPNRAIHSLRRNLVDGYFAIGPSAGLDAIATRSDPVALEKWYFYTTTPQLNTETARIGVVGGSSEEAWLSANGYQVFLTVTSPAQLVALLKRGRIDTALMDQRMMNDLRSENAHQERRFSSHFLRYAPLYLYLSAPFATSHPAFLGELNRFLPDCMATPLKLTEEEASRLRTLARGLLHELEASVTFQKALEAGPRMDSLADVLTIDSKWQALPAQITPALAERLLKLPASRALRDWQRAQGGLVTEVMLINDMGTLVAMSQRTSDYWQGDEPKFQGAMAMAATGTETGWPVYMSSIHYDTSTARFQVTVSAPVAPGNGAGANGVIAFGLDIEQALSDAEGI